MAEEKENLIVGNDAVGSGLISILPGDNRHATVLSFVSDNGERTETFAVSKWELKRLIAELVNCL